MTQTDFPIRELYHGLIKRCLEPEEWQLVNQFIEQYKLTGFINEILHQVEHLIDGVQSTGNLNVEEVKTIAYRSLKKFNQFIRQLGDKEEKSALKGHLSKVVRGIMIEIHQRVPMHAREVQMAIEQGMEQAVFVERYDKGDFEQHLQLDYKDVSKARVSVEKGSDYLVWHHQKANLNRLIYLLQNDYGCIKSGNDFKGLFDNPDGKGKIKWDNKKTDLLIILFRELYDRKWITLKRGKGLWKVIKNRIMDFDKNNLTMDFAKRLNKLKAKNPANTGAARDAKEILSAIKIN